MQCYKGFRYGFSWVIVSVYKELHVDCQHFQYTTAIATCNEFVPNQV